MDKMGEVGSESISYCDTVTCRLLREGDQVMRIHPWIPLVLQSTENDEDPS